METSQIVTVQLSAEQWQALNTQFYTLANELVRLQTEMRSIDARRRADKKRDRKRKENENYVPWGGPDSW